MKAIDVSLDSGIRKSLEPITLNAFLQNLYLTVGDKTLHRFPKLSQKLLRQNLVASKKTTYNDGVIFVVTKTDLLEVNENSFTVKLLRTISLNSENVRITENQQNQVVIVDGSQALVYDQPKSTLTKLGLDEGFSLTNPIDCITIDNYTVIFDGKSLKFIVSKNNNALSYGGNETKIMDESLGFIKGAAVSMNRFYVFGSYDIKVWQPSSLRASDLDPFLEVPQSSHGIGALSTKSIVEIFNTIFFVASDYSVRMQSNDNFVSITSAGLIKYFKSIGLNADTKGSVYHYNGQYFYHLNISDSENYAYNIYNQTWSKVDRAIFSSISPNEQSLLILSDGIYEFTDSLYDSELIKFVSIPVALPRNIDKTQYTLSGVLFEMLTGTSSTDNSQIEVYISTDNVNFDYVNKITMPTAGNYDMPIVAPGPLTGDRFTIRFEYYGDQPFLVESIKLFLTTGV